MLLVSIMSLRVRLISRLTMSAFSRVSRVRGLLWWIPLFKLSRHVVIIVRIRGGQTSIVVRSLMRLVGVVGGSVM